jgi:hypothetical protein
VRFTKYNSDHLIKQDEIGKGIYRRAMMGNLKGTRLLEDGNTILKRVLKNGL